MDIRKVKKLIELLDESGIAEIEITEGEDAVRISRYPTGTPIAAPMPAAPAPAPAPPQQPASSSGGDAAADRGRQKEGDDESGFEVAAPMVGTFYAAASPGAAPYVQVGDRVSEGDTLCIIEAMKMMNQIEAETAGVIKSIRVQNGEPVEYGQTLFVIDQRGA